MFVAALSPQAVFDEIMIMKVLRASSFLSPIVYNVSKDWLELKFQNITAHILIVS